MVWKLKKFKFESRKCYNKLICKYMFKNFFQNISCLNNLLKNRSLYNDGLDFSLVIKWEKFTPKSKGSVRGNAQNKEGKGGRWLWNNAQSSIQMICTPCMNFWPSSLYLTAFAFPQKNETLSKAMFHKHNNNSPPQRDQKPPPSLPPSLPKLRE